MQISTIDIRIDSVEKAKPGKTDGKENAGAESAFAAFFASAQQDAKQAAAAKAVPADDADATDDVDAAHERTAESARTEKATTEKEAGTKPESTVAGQISGKSELDGAGKSNGETTTSHARHGKGIHAKHAVRPHHVGLPLTHLDAIDAHPAGKTPAAAPAIGGEGVQGIAAETTPIADMTEPAPQSAAVRAMIAEAELTAVAAVRAMIAEAELTAVAALPVKATTSSKPATPVDAAMPEDMAALNATELAEAAPVAAPANDGEGRAVAQDATATAQVPATGSKPAAKAGADVQAPADIAKTSPSAVIATDVDADDATVEADGVTADDATAKPVEAAPRAEPQVVRNTTQWVAPDGSVVATRTVETRTEHAQSPAQREGVVIERTTVQALPEQALRGARYLVSNGEQTMRIRLVPESLGEVRLEVTAANGEVSVKLASANAAVREILQTHAPGLQSAIAQDNAGAVRVTVTPDVPAGAWLSSNAQRHAGQHGADAPHREAANAPYRGPNPQMSAAPRREAAHAGKLNVYV
ncbi:MAG: hypothetical protein FJY92_00595 [Candidatus Hydrogenedentes bacterium]|nr:hypothetical protein [Candidatus Hydrogenedentota bacterium]